MINALKNWIVFTDPIYRIVLYLILWFLMPARPGEGSGLDRVVDAVSRLAGDNFSGRSEDEDDSRDRAPSYHDPL